MPLIPLLMAAIALLSSNVAQAQNCQPSAYVVQGISMLPSIPPGGKLESIPYSCLPRELTHNDVIIFKSGADINPLIKRVAALPGDRFAVTGNLLLINNEIAKNSAGQFYQLSPSHLAMIKLYEDGNEGIIPEDALLVLGDDAYGSTDSGRLGLISTLDIIAVMVRPLPSIKADD